MTDFGGLGGSPVLLSFDTEDLFAVALRDALGEQMKARDELCAQVWSALANTEWSCENGDTASYSFRAAGDLIASIIERGNYMDWYCSGPYAVVTEQIADAMAAKGWKAKITEMGL